MEKGLVARARITIEAPVADVWNALVTPEIIARYMFGTNVVSDWKEGGAILWRGEWKGRAYEDRGRLLRVRPQRMLRYSHYSPLSGVPDLPENHHTVTIELSPRPGARTDVSLSQDNDATEDARRHSESNWRMMLEALKRVVEEGARAPARGTSPQVGPRSGSVSWNRR